MLFSAAQCFPDHFYWAFGKALFNGVDSRLLVVGFSFSTLVQVFNMVSLIFTTVIIVIVICHLCQLWLNLLSVFILRKCSGWPYSNPAHPTSKVCPSYSSTSYTTSGNNYRSFMFRVHLIYIFLFPKKLSLCVNACLVVYGFASQDWNTVMISFPFCLRHLDTFSFATFVL